MNDALLANLARSIEPQKPKPTTAFVATYKFDTHTVEFNTLPIIDGEIVFPESLGGESISVSDLNDGGYDSIAVTREDFEDDYDGLIDTPELRADLQSTLMLRWEHLREKEERQKRSKKPVRIVTDKKYDMTDEELRFQNEEAPYPIFKLHETAGPSFDDSKLYGVLGQVTRRVCEFSEACPAAVYLNLIVSIGSIFGRNAYFNVGKTTHYTNENLACIGSSSIGRKGSSSDAAESILHLLDGQWMSNRNQGCFATPQAVLSEIRDGDSFQKLNPKTKIYEVINRPGITDKRLCIREGELSNVFKLMADSKQKAAELIRNLWDSKPVSNKVAGKSADGEHNSLICREPHVSIIGSSTPSLAKGTLPVGASTSGDGNRFIWCYVKRTQLSPTGGPDIEWTSDTEIAVGTQMNLFMYLLDAVRHGKAKRFVPIAPSANKTWFCLYQRLENDQRAGFLGGMTSRAAAHIRRLAMILCLVDRKEAIEKCHLKAAEDIWDYSLACAQFIFTGYSTEQAKILRLAQDKGSAGITITDVHELFGRNKSGAWIKAQVKSLRDEGYLTKNGDIYYFKRA